MAAKNQRGYGSAASSGIGMPVLIVAVVVALVAGGLVGHFAFGGSSASATFSGKTTIAEGDLDKTVGTFTYDGKTETVSARDAIQSQATLDSVKQDDGTYTMPSADAVLSVARNRIVSKVAEEQGVTVSDDDISSYAEQMVGTSDIATIASNYNMDEDQAKEIIRQSATMYKLKEKVVSTQAGTQPTAPTTPEDGNQDTASADYWTYITGLLGDEWDSTNNKWARQDGPYYEALSSETFDGETATYAQAQKAYYVAYQQYSSNSTAASTEWSNYLNGILSSAAITLNTLTA